MLKPTWKTLVAVALCLAVGTACATTHDVRDVKQHPTENVATIATQSMWFEWGFNCGFIAGFCSEMRYWHCADEGSDELHCNQVCGANMDVDCAGSPGMIQATRSAGAQFVQQAPTAPAQAAEPEAADEEVAEEAETDAEDEVE